MEKGKAKMPEYEYDCFDGSESTHSVDSEFGGFDVPIGVRKPSHRPMKSSVSLPVKRIMLADSATTTICVKDEQLEDKEMGKLMR